MPCPLSPPPSGKSASCSSLGTSVDVLFGKRDILSELLIYLGMVYPAMFPIIQLMFPLSQLAHCGFSILVCSWFLVWFTNYMHVHTNVVSCNHLHMLVVPKLTGF